jgi:hypothetical protein
MTALVNPVCDIALTKYEIDGKGQITLFGNINSAQLDTGFTFRELGVFAVIEEPGPLGGTPTPGGAPASGRPASGVTAITETAGVPGVKNPVVPTPGYGTPVMYSYCNSYEESDFIPGSDQTTVVVNTIEVTIKIDVAASIQVIINAGAQLSLQNIGPVEVGAGPWSYTQASIGYFKRFVQGPGLLITEDTDTITVGAKQLTSDLDLYVANGNPDISPDFSTVQNAIDYLGQYLIPTTIRARINLSPQTFNISKAISLNHPNAGCITIQGPQNPTLAGNSITSITGGANNWSVTFGGFADTSSVVVGGYAIIDYINPTGGNNEGIATGIFLVTAVAATTVTVKVPYRGASLSITGVNSVRLTAITAIILANKDVSAFGSGTGIGLMQYIAFVAAAIPTVHGTTGIGITGKGSMKFVGVYGFAGATTGTPCQTHGLVSWNQGSNLALTSCAATANQQGIVGGSGGSISFGDNNVSSHNSSRNFWFDSGGSTYFGGLMNRATSAGEMNMIVTGGSVCGLAYYNPKGKVVVKLQGHASHGLYVGSRSFMNSPNTQTYASIDITGTPGGAYDVCIDPMSFATINGCVTGTRRYNIPVGQLSSLGALIL